MTENKQFHLKIKWKDYKKTEAIEIVLYDGGHPVCELISVEDAKLVRNILNDQHELITSLKSVNMELEDANARLEETITEQAIQLDYLQDENKHMRDVLNEKEEQLQLFIELAKKHNKTIDELYRFMRDYLNSRNENTYWNPELRYRKW